MGRFRGSDVVHAGVDDTQTFGRPLRTPSFPPRCTPTRDRSPGCQGDPETFFWYPELAFSLRGEVGGALGGELHPAPCVRCHVSRTEDPGGSAGCSRPLSLVSEGPVEGFAGTPHRGPVRGEGLADGPEPSNGYVHEARSLSQHSDEPRHRRRRARPRSSLCRLGSRSHSQRALWRQSLRPGGTDDIEPAERWSGSAPRRAYAELGGDAVGLLSECDGDQYRPGSRADRKVAGRRSPQVVAAVRENSGRPGGSVHGPTVVSRSLSKLRAVLAGLAVVAVVGLATPSVLGMVTVSLWTHGPLFDVQGLARLALFLLDAVAWVAWLRIIVALCLDVASGLRQPNAPQRSGGVRGHLAGWVLGFVLLVLPGSAMGAGVAVAAPVASWVSVGSPGPDLTAAQAPPSAPISSVSSTRPAISPAVSPTEGADYTVVSGDCLSTIALHFYGDEGAWTEIWAANANRIMTGGMRFGDPNLIYAGWILTLPGLPGPSPSESHPSRSAANAPFGRTFTCAHGFSSAAADPPRASGQRPRDGLGDPKSSVPGRTQGASDDEHIGAVPTRAGLCQRAGRGRGTWRGYGGLNNSVASWIARLAA